MIIKKLFQKIFIGAGAALLLVFVITGLDNPAFGSVGVILLFTGATNFFTRCPLLSAFTRMFKGEQVNKIPTRKI